MPKNPQNQFPTPYIENLLADPDFYQSAIETLLEKYKVLPVGAGYIDLILDREDAVDLVDELASIPIALRQISWWCHCTGTSSGSGCPHGGGGPKIGSGPAYFSECYQHPHFNLQERGVDFESPFMAPRMLAGKAREAAANYLLLELPKQEFFSPCLTPGLWLEVPEAWKRKQYLVEKEAG
jgi:hypothetical protein